MMQVKKSLHDFINTCHCESFFHQDKLSEAIFTQHEQKIRLSDRIIR